jgi:DNA-binding NtrC family response regulator
VNVLEQSMVLVVDDDPTIRMLLRDALELEGYGVEASATLPEALAVLHQRNIGVIITDTFGADPTSPNLDFLVSLRTVAPCVTVILCTAHFWAQTLNAQQHGLFAVLPKPFDLLDLFRTIDRAVHPNHADAASLRMSPT